VKREKGKKKERKEEETNDPRIPTRDRELHQAACRRIVKWTRHPLDEVGRRVGKKKKKKERGKSRPWAGKGGHGDDQPLLVI